MRVEKQAPSQLHGMPHGSGPGSVPPRVGTEIGIRLRGTILRVISR
jgi:hypothetical protein